eukprot:2865264-Prymnesium_polylepis.1
MCQKARAAPRRTRAARTSTEERSSHTDRPTRTLRESTQDAPWRQRSPSANRNRRQRAGPRPPSAHRALSTPAETQRARGNATTCRHTQAAAGAAAAARAHR